MIKQRGPYAYGSFGLHPAPRNRDASQVIYPWFCGGWAAGRYGHKCAHMTRREARECPRRPGKEVVR